MLGAKSDTATLVFQNALNLSTNGGTIEMTSGAATVDADLSNGISDSPGDTTGLIIQGQGTLELSANNTYTGPTTISASPGPLVLRLGNATALPGGTGASGGLSNLVLDGGILELAAGNFTRGIRTRPARCNGPATAAGSSASGGSRAVNLGGSLAQVTWGSGSSAPDGAPLMLGSPSDDSTVVFENPINLGSSIQNVELNHGTAAVDAVLSGNLTGAGGLDVSGNGVLQLRGRTVSRAA